MSPSIALQLCARFKHNDSWLLFDQQVALYNTPLLVISVAAAGALGVSTFAVLLYNIFGMYVTDSVGAAARVVLENARTLLVWLVSILGPAHTVLNCTQRRSDAAVASVASTMVCTMLPAHSAEVIMVVVVCVVWWWWWWWAGRV
jgi:hypothetical protein